MVWVVVGLFVCLDGVLFRVGRGYDGDLDSGCGGLYELLEHCRAGCLIVSYIVV